MDHQSFQEQISQLLDNELDSRYAPPLFQHLGECDVCRTFFLRSNAIHAAAGQMLPADVPEILDRKFSLLSFGKKRQPMLTRTFSVSLSSMLLSASVLLFMFAFIYIFSTIQGERYASQYRQTVSISRQAAAISVDIN